MVGINMEMPNNCYDCYRNMYCIVGIDGGWRPDKRVEGCPLVEIGTCKDCKKYRNSLEHCTQWVMTTNDDFYCADFEKARY